MKKKQLIISTIFVIIVFTVPLSTSLQAEVCYNVIALNKPVSSLGNYAFSINNNGQIVGSHYTLSMMEQAVIFDWNDQNNYTILGSDSEAWSINNSGQIVGLAVGGATLFDPTGHGNNINLGTISGMNGLARSIGDNGQIVGWAGGGGSNDSKAVLFDSTGDGNNIDLGTLGGTNSQALSINSSGQIVGGAKDGSGKWRACLFDQTGHGNNIDLGTLGGIGSEAEFINNKGQIVGAAAVNSGRGHACLFDPTGNGNNIDLGPGVAYAINNNGQILGEDNNGTPTLFDPTGHGNNIALYTLIDPNIGWTVGSGFGLGVINDNGWIVMGNYVLIPLPGPPMIPLTIEVRPAGLGINTVIPFPGTTQHTQFTNVALNARNFPLCPSVYLFDHWEGEGIADINAPYTHVLMNNPKTVTAVFVLGERRCGDECHQILQGDLNKDCYVNFEDFALYCTQWLSCTHPDCD